MKRNAEFPAPSVELAQGKSQGLAALSDEDYMNLVADVWKRAKKASTVPVGSPNRYYDALGTRLLEILADISKEKTIQVWDDDEIAVFLTANFPENHAIWKHVKLRVATMFSRQIAEGLYRAITVAGQTLVVIKPYSSVLLHRGEEQIAFALDCPRDSNRRWVEIYRNVQNKTTWGAEYHHSASLSSGVFQGADFPVLKDVVAAGIRFLIDMSDEESRKAAETLSSKWRWEKRSKDGCRTSGS
jgi:hypothetical protein